MRIRGLILDVDGTIADTEEIHRQAFNRTFEEYALDWYWSVNDYRELLLISGGKERFKKCLNEDITLKKKIGDPSLFILELYQRKSEHYRSLLASENIQLRPGMIRLINEVREKGIPIGIATSSSVANLKTLINQTLKLEPEDLFSAIVSGDTVSDKKPCPMVYQCVLAELGLSGEDCIAIEDTRNGNLAALSCGLPTIITTHSYTVDNSFEDAALVINNLGEPNEPFLVSQGQAYGKIYVDTELLNKIVSQKYDIEPVENNVAQVVPM